MEELGIKKTMGLSDGREVVYRTSFKENSPPQGTPLIVLNNGLVCGNAWWYYTIKLFDSIGVPYLMHEYRGHFDGNYVKDKKKVNLQQFSHDLEEILDGIDADKVIMVGHSMGVNVTLHYLISHPQRVLAMALISGTPIAPGDYLFNFKYAKRLLPLLFIDNPLKDLICNQLWKTSHFNPVALKLVHVLGTDPERVPAKIIKWYMKDLASIDFRVFVQLVREMEDFNVLQELQSINIPSLVIGGTKDPLCPLPLQKMLHENLKGSEFLVIPGSRHVPQIDNPELVNGRILSLLKRVS
ncbi:MAG: alpha/beta hydrolase [Bdellovibrio sp.]|nr:alpha/beta hydrolase [Bdellovibrio sp.]